MPWTEKQLRLFRAAAHDPAIAAKHGLTQQQAKKMSEEGKRKMYAEALKTK